MSTLSLELPEAVSKALGEDAQAAGREALVALAVSLYRQKKLSHHQVACSLGLDRFETDALLKSHGALLEITADEFASELNDLRRAVGR
jgi:predicted HTH domain antitoxin